MTSTSAGSPLRWHRAVPITVAELPEGISAKIYQLAGLMKGDYEDDIIKVLQQRGRLRCMQGYLKGSRFLH